MSVCLRRSRDILKPAERRIDRRGFANDKFRVGRVLVRHPVPRQHVPDIARRFVWAYARLPEHFNGSAKLVANMSLSFTERTEGPGDDVSFQIDYRGAVGATFRGHHRITMSGTHT